jgi:hypothetical protein
MAYFGLVPKLSDDAVNLLGTFVNKEELKDGGFLNLKSDAKDEELDPKNDGNIVQSILEKLDVPALESQDNGNYEHNKVLETLKRDYDLNKPELRQFCQLADVMWFDPEVIEALVAVSDKLKKDPDLWNKLLYLQMTVDILNNLIRPPTSEAALAGYLEKRISLPDLERYYPIDQDLVRRHFREFYKIFRQAKKHQVFVGHAVIPYDGSAELIRVKGPDDVAQIKALLGEGGFDELLSSASSSASSSTSLTKDSVQALKEKDGGLDFSETEKNIEFRENQNSPAINPAPFYPDQPLPVLQLFQGFDFKIINLQALENPVNFLSS